MNARPFLLLLLVLVDGYRQFYSAFDYFPSKYTMRAYKHAVNRAQPTRHSGGLKSVEEVAIAIKKKHSLKQYKKDVAHPKRNLETGDFLTLEFFRTVLTDKPGKF